MMHIAYSHQSSKGFPVQVLAQMSHSIRWNHRGFSCDIVSSQFVSHHSNDQHGGFLFAQVRIGKHNNKSC